MVVEVWSDVVCPWCYIGKRRFAAALARARRRSRRSTPTIEVVYRPFQLDPTAPPGTTMPVAEAYARKFGGPEQAAAIIDNITGIAAAEGLEFHLDRAQRANTRDAHRLLWYAETSGPPGAQATLKERLLAAYFVDGRNVGDPDVLAEEAAAAGLDADDVRGVPRQRRRHRRGRRGAGVRRRGRDHRRADVRHRRPVVDPRRPGPGRVRPGAAAPGRRRERAG